MDLAICPIALNLLFRHSNRLRFAIIGYKDTFTHSASIIQGGREKDYFHSAIISLSSRCANNRLHILPRLNVINHGIFSTYISDYIFKDANNFRVPGKIARI